MTLTDVTSRLNATGPDTSNNYTVFGLQINGVAINAIIDDVNTLIGNASKAQPSNSAYEYGIVAAKALACMHVLVVASGGSVTDANNYQVGDLSVQKATVTQMAYVGAINAFRDTYNRAVTNFTAGVEMAKAKLAHEIPHRRRLGSNIASFE